MVMHVHATSMEFPYKSLHIPSSKDEFHGPTSGVYEVPVTLFWQGSPIDMDSPGDVRWFYSSAVSANSPAELIASWVDFPTLNREWQKLSISPTTRRLWETIHPDLNISEEKMNFDDTLKHVQDTLLSAVAPTGFALGGGGALQEWMFEYRSTQDVDVYTDFFESSIFDDVSDIVRDVCRINRWEIHEVVSKDVFRAYDVVVGEHTIRVDLGYDHRVHDPEKRRNGGFILSFSDVVASKAVALCDRCAPRDILDVAVIARHHGSEFLWTSLRSHNPHLVEEASSVISDVIDGVYDTMLLEAKIGPDTVKKMLRDAGFSV